ncbi:hypothetical protein [Actinoplanes rectilineatus]|uniref:hypothetical protein n=1 Tax=Actinoplanes rectilineatus TaxID=113571 RepID=UPI0005F2F911|nr:hypothetical protein [Actinoplanes rectilineatus]
MVNASVRIIGVLLTLVTVLTGAPARAAEPEVRSAPTFDGTVTAIAYLAGTVYVGGSFTRASWDGRTYRRLRLAAFDARTGALLNWAPAADGPVRALAATGDDVFAAGGFHTVDGHRRDSLARISAVTAEVAGFSHDLDGTAYALAAGNGRLYLGGSFSAVDGREHRNLAAFDLATGLLDDGWAARTDDRVHTLAANGAEVYLGGAFHRVNGEKHTLRLAAVDAVTGDLDRYFRPRVTAEVNALTVDPSGIYTAGGGQGGRAVAYGFDGTVRWQRVFDGDAVAITRRHGVTYVGGHFDRACLTPRNGPQGSCLDGSLPRVKLAAITGEGTLTGWAPQANGVIGVRVLNADRTADALDAGGDFTTIDGSDRRRFARFSG